MNEISDEDAELIYARADGREAWIDYSCAYYALIDYGYDPGSKAAEAFREGFAEAEARNTERNMRP